MTRGRFIVFEGGEGTGKSTQAALLAQRLGATLTHEPGGTELGAHLREVLLSERTRRLDDRAEALLMAADRAQHVAEVIEPTLRSGRHVVCDRYIGSSVAYQGYGRLLDPDMVRAISGWAAGGLWPDLTILLTVPEEVARARIGPARDRIEAAGDDFHRRVLDGFLEQAAEEPDTWVVLDGSGTPEEVAEEVADVVADALGLEVGGA
ncbi:MAG TPA: dTMP kinase [Microthrixaceae bacterium]|nr:dTMP kinase [Microthrixaceae bacterium]